MTVSPLPLPALPLPAAPTTGDAPRHEGLTVFVRGLRLEAGIGVHDHELGRLQPLVIDVTLELAPASIERLADTINYETVASAARAITAAGHVGLVETFAERLATACLSIFGVLAYCSGRSLLVKVRGATIRTR